MKIAITAKGNTLEDPVDPRFGRCPVFLIVDTDTLETEAIDNTNAALGGGAGIQSAQLMAERDVKAVLTGNCGPNAYQTLNAAGIEVIVGVSGRIRDVLEQFKAGSLSATQGPNVASHFGTGPGGALSSAAGRGMGAAPVGNAGPTSVPSTSGGSTEADALKIEAQTLERQLQTIKERLAQVESGRTDVEEGMTP